MALRVSIASWLVVYNYTLLQRPWFDPERRLLFVRSAACSPHVRIGFFPPTEHLPIGVNECVVNEYGILQGTGVQSGVNSLTWNPVFLG